MSNSFLAANRGEWSEIYAFLKVLLDGEVATKNGRMYPILSIQRMDREWGINYRMQDGWVCEISWPSIPEPHKVALPDLKTYVHGILAWILNSEGRSFHLPVAESIMGVLGCAHVKSSSDNKSDLIMTTIDGSNVQEIHLGFSIKSWLWWAPTLLNASKQTNFLYKIAGLPSDSIQDIGSNHTYKVQGKVKAIYEAGGHLEFVMVCSDNFRHNLVTSDYVLPIIMSEILLAYYRGLDRKTANIVGLALGSSPILNELGMSLDQIEYKVKILLENIALGMVPSKVWDGTHESDGGYLVVDEFWEILCLHKYWRNLFKDYLFEHTCFDTGSTGRNEFGEFYKWEGGEWFVRLNMQIRFTK